MCYHSNKTVIWEFNTANFTVRATIEPDHDTDLSWDETGEIAEKLESGEMESFQTEIAVMFKGCEIGADYLGGSIYANPKDFFIEHYGVAAKSRADGKNYGAYFPDMVREAIRMARNTLASAPKMRAA